jgi:cyclophilin family peptidyl-prolyl cis-trans isomerase
MRLLKLIPAILLLVIFQYTNGTPYNERSIDFKVNKTEQDRKDGIYAEFNTNKGRIVARLEYEKTPLTVANFIGLTEGTISNASFPKGVSFYKGSVWHRVVKGHVIQGGSPVTDKAPEKEETGSTGYVIPNEITDLRHNKAGILGMANSGPHTNTCQYYITLAERSYLDGNYTVFGEVVEGIDVVNAIIQGDTTYSISIIRKGKDAESFIVNDVTFKKMLDYQWNKVKQEEKTRKENDEKFISGNFPGLIATASGLRYKILNPGSGDHPPKGSVLNVSYTGRLINGVTFTSSAESGRPTANINPTVFEYSADSGDFIKGLREGLAEMKEGEKRLLIIPSSLAYGENGFYARNIAGQKRFVISPGETLILEVTLISFK